MVQETNQDGHLETDKDQTEEPHQARGEEAQGLGVG